MSMIIYLHRAKITIFGTTLIFDNDPLLAYSFIPGMRYLKKVKGEDGEYEYHVFFKDHWNIDIICNNLLRNPAKLSYSFDFSTLSEVEITPAAEKRIFNHTAREEINSWDDEEKERQKLKVLEEIPYSAILDGDNIIYNGPGRKEIARVAFPQTALDYEQEDDFS